MRFWLDIAEGPLFRAALLIMLVGLIRVVLLTILDIVRLKLYTPDRRGPIVGQIGAGVKWLARWFAPPKEMISSRPWYTAVSALFHLGIVLVPLFYIAHVALWARGFGLTAPSYANDTFNFTLAFDALTLLTIITGVALFAMRVANDGARALSKLQDWLLTPLVVAVFLTGFLAAHPQHNPIGYTTTRLIHVLSGDLLMILIPFTKLAHVVLLPFTRLLDDVSWKFVPGVGEKVRIGLGIEDKPV